MREIKFRAWDKENKKMVPWDTCMFADTSPVTCYGDEFPTDDEYFFLMQYTGLKDEKGKEIYEGDIVWRRTTHSQPKLVVKWGEIGWNPFEDDLCGLGSVAYYEVIGNIHENPELLER